MLIYYSLLFVYVSILMWTVLYPSKLFIINWQSWVTGLLH